MSRLISELDDALEERAVKGLRRERRIVDSAQGARLRVDGREVLHFGSNDYLGLAADSRVVAAAQAGSARYGVGAGASHLISGHFAPHDVIERELAAWIAPCASARALHFSTGYLANLAIVTALVGRGDAVFADKLNHACLNDAALLSRADFVRHAHGDLEALEKSLAASAARRKLIATDAVFSMDGDIAALGKLLALAGKYDAWLVVDDAHGLGVLGATGGGALEVCGVKPEDAPVLVGTLGKAFGSYGAFVAGSATLIELLIQKARTYIYTTALPQPVAAATRQALKLAQSESWRRERVLALTARFRRAAAAAGVVLSGSTTPIQPIVLGSAASALAAQRSLAEAGLWVVAIRPPTVPQGAARLRITLSAAHAEAEVDELVACLARACADAARGVA